MKVLLENASVELWNCSEFLLLRGVFSEPRLASVLWPQSLKHLSLGWMWWSPITAVSANPSTLQQLSLRGRFNQPIDEVIWPAFLQQLSFGDHFNQPIVGVMWPASLQQLSFGKLFNQRASLQPAHRRSCVAGHSAAAVVPGFLQPAHRRSHVAGHSAAAVIRGLVQPAHRRSCVAAFTAAAIVRT